MGNTPSQPTDEQVEELKEKRNQMIEAAAAAIATADVLLVTTGAGWSADSGLAVYKDVADVPAYHKRELTYHALCNPGVLDEDPALFHGFWGGCFNDYRKATLSPGYALVAGWCDRRFRGTPTSEELAELIRQDEQDPKRYPLLEARELARARAAGKEPAAEPTAANAEAASAIPRPERGASAFFSFTSNVDAHWTTVCRPGELRECHGNTEMWQCTDLSCAAALETEARGSGPSPVAGAAFVPLPRRREDARGAGRAGAGLVSRGGLGPAARRRGVRAQLAALRALRWQGAAERAHVRRLAVAGRPAAAGRMGVVAGAAHGARLLARAHHRRRRRGNGRARRGRDACRRRAACRRQAAFGAAAAGGHHGGWRGRQRDHRAPEERVGARG